MDKDYTHWAWLPYPHDSVGRIRAAATVYIEKNDQYHQIWEQHGVEAAWHRLIGILFRIKETAILANQIGPSKNNSDLGEDLINYSIMLATLLMRDETDLNRLLSLRKGVEDE